MTATLVGIPAVAPPRVAARLAGPARGARVLHRGRDALYLDVDGWCLGVVRAGAVPVPCALVVPGTVDLAGVTEATVEDGGLRLDDDVVTVARLRDVVVPPIRAVHPDAVPVLRTHARPARAELGSVADPSALVGLGSGLTPLGDDVLAGHLATSFALSRVATSYDVRGRTTLLSATLVDCAARGEVLPQFRDVVAALPDVAALEVAAARLAGVGHTSGAGLLLGASLCLI